MGFVRYFKKVPKWQLVILSVFSVFGISVLDYATGPDLSLSIFYLPSIFFAEWLLGSYWGVFISVLSGLGWFLADILWRESFPHPLILPWNFLVITGTFLIFDYFAATLRDTLARERNLARIDPLTGVFNRRAFLEIVRAEILRGQRTEEPLTMAYLDIDDFKQINDRLGHIKGDQALIVMAQTILAHVRATDVVARLGGDEFAILLPSLLPGSAQGVLKKLQRSLVGRVNEEKIQISVSIGALTFLETPTSVDEMIIKADSLMYEVKANGKGDLLHQVDRGVKLPSEELTSFPG